MPKELILYAGLHKTASSSIQRTCGKNRTQLARAGFTFPLTPTQGKLGTNHTAALVCMFKREPTRYGRLNQFDLGNDEFMLKLKEDLRQAMANALPSVRGKLLLVAEGVSVLPLEELLELKQWFLDHGFETRLVCHIRHLSGWINSMISQRVTGPMRMTIEEAVREFAQYGGIVRPSIENIRSAFPDAQFYSHETAIAHPRGPVGFFLEHAGVAGEGFEYLSVNAGKSDLATRALSLVNEKFGKFDNRCQDNPQFFGVQEQMRVFRSLVGPKFRLRRQEVEPILPALEAENRWLGKSFGPGFHDPSLRFDDCRVQWPPETLDRLRQVSQACRADVRDWLLANAHRWED